MGNVLGEVRYYDNSTDPTYMLFRVYEVAVGQWLSTLMVNSDHEELAVINSSPDRAFSDDQLAAVGKELINGQIPTPICSFFISDFSKEYAKEIPPEVKYHNRTYKKKFSDLRPFKVNFTVSFWTRKKADLYDLMYQLETRFNPQEWLFLVDPISGRTQTIPMLIDSRSDTSNLESGDQPRLLRYDYIITMEAWLPLPGEIDTFYASGVIVQFASANYVQTVDAPTYYEPIGYIPGFETLEVSGTPNTTTSTYTPSSGTPYSGVIANYEFVNASIYTNMSDGVFASFDSSDSLNISFDSDKILKFDNSKIDGINNIYDLMIDLNNEAVSIGSEYDDFTSISGENLIFTNPSNDIKSTLQILPTTSTNVKNVLGVNFDVVSGYFNVTWE